MVGLGAHTAIGGVGGRGHQLIPRLREVPGARIVALCDVDQAFLDRKAQPFKDRGEEVATHTDLRRVFDDQTIDAVVIESWLEHLRQHDRVTQADRRLQEQVNRFALGTPKVTHLIGAEPGRESAQEPDQPRHDQR